MRPVRADNFGTYFVTSSTAGGRHLLQSERMARLFIETLYHYRNQEKYLLHEFVVMPNHVHLMITPNESTIERAVQFVKGGFSYRARAILPALEIWQKGFTDHRIRNVGDYEQHREYIWMNPVRARLCASPEEYPYSSANPEFQTDAPPQRLKPLSSAASNRLG